MSEALYTHYVMSSDGELTVLGYAYGEPWVEQALYMDDMRYPTPEAAKAAWEALMKVVMNDVRNPPVEMKPVVRARWEICSDGYYPYCSNCKNEPQGRVMTDFCPNCGADMRGETND